MVVSHLKAMGEPNWGTVAAALERIDDAGPAVAADQYPYTASSTMLAAVAASGRIGTLVTPDAVHDRVDDRPPGVARTFAGRAGRPPRGPRRSGGDGGPGPRSRLRP